MFLKAVPQAKKIHMYAPFPDGQVGSTRWGVAEASSCKLSFETRNSALDTIAEMTKTFLQKGDMPVKKTLFISLGGTKVAT